MLYIYHEKGRNADSFNPDMKMKLQDKNKNNKLIVRCEI